MESRQGNPQAASHRKPKGRPLKPEVTHTVYLRCDGRPVMKCLTPETAQEIIEGHTPDMQARLTIRPIKQGDVP